LQLKVACCVWVCGAVVVVAAHFDPSQYEPLGQPAAGGSAAVAIEVAAMPDKRRKAARRDPIACKRFMATSTEDY